MLTILSRLDRERYETALVCPEDGPLHEMAGALEVRTESLAQLEARFTWRVTDLLGYLKSFTRVISDFRRVVLKMQPDLIHANSVRAGLVATAATIDLGIPVAWHVHDLLPRHPLSTFIRLAAACSRRTRAIAISEAVAHSFLGRFSWMMRNRLDVILNAIDSHKFEAGETARDAIREELGIKADVWVLGIVGQLAARKGQLELIRAIARSGLSNLQLLIVGAPLFAHDREYARALEAETKLAGLSERVHFLGSRDDISAIMKALDLLVVNSSAEPFGLVVLEAMSCGTPVLATKAGGVPEIIKHGEDGWLVPARDEQALTEAIVYLSTHSDVRARLAEQGEQRVKLRFTLDRFMNELQRFYEANGDRARTWKSKTIAFAQPQENLPPDRSVDPA